MTHSRSSIPNIWLRLVAFGLGASVQLNILIGGGGEGVGTTGGFGYRLSDFLSVLSLIILGFYALWPRKLISLLLFVVVLGCIALIRFLEPSFWNDGRTVILLAHYVAYSFLALYVAMLIEDQVLLDRFCWGLIAGLVGTIPIFVFQDLGQSKVLVDIGILPGYSSVLNVSDISGFRRYAALWGHPNEAGHVAALSAAAGAYFASFQRRLLPFFIVGISFLVIFYYTQSRGGLIAGASILVAAMVFSSRGSISMWRLIGMAVMAFFAAVVLLQFDFVASRFADDNVAASNLLERLESMRFGLEIMFANPFGYSVTDFKTIMSAGTGGVNTPHNGFIFIGGVFGIVPLALIVITFILSFRIKNATDVFFAFLTAQVSLSFLFEEMAASYAYAFIICLIVAHIYLRTAIGRGLLNDSGMAPRREPLLSRRPVNATFKS